MNYYLDPLLKTKKSTKNLIFSKNLKNPSIPRPITDKLHTQ